MKRTCQSRFKWPMKLFTFALKVLKTTTKVLPCQVQSLQLSKHRQKNLLLQPKKLLETYKESMLRLQSRLTLVKSIKQSKTWPPSRMPTKKFPLNTSKVKSGYSISGPLGAGHAKHQWHITNKWWKRTVMPGRIRLESLVFQSTKQQMQLFLKLTTRSGTLLNTSTEPNPNALQPMVSVVFLMLWLLIKMATSFSRVIQWQDQILNKTWTTLWTARSSQVQALSSHKPENHNLFFQHSPPHKVLLKWIMPRLMKISQTSNPQWTNWPVKNLSSLKLQNVQETSQLFSDELPMTLQLDQTKHSPLLRTTEFS